ncbi:MAG: N-acetylmuramoyl-L-alanine amidase [candidate division Zixibacteria bacterium]|nr:N-acetylmuramoyl-L-alanine amidase [candidate division Zixibacteria bacterium]
MKKNKLIMGLFVVTLLLFSRNSFAQNIVCIDPGHGGPGASKYWYNGGGKNQNKGSVGPYLHLTEQWINLEVAKELRWQIYFYPNFSVVMTRETDTTDISTVERAHMANDSLADWFISIHHNGFDSIPSLFQRSLAFYCDSPKTPVYPQEDRITDSLLAKKILFRVQNYFHYADGCSSQCGSTPNCKDDGILYCELCFDVLHYSTMVSALSEASNISYDEYEEGLFDNVNGHHILEEALGIYHGWKSYMQGAGIAKVMTRWIGGDGGQLRIDTELRASPFVSCWEQFEVHTLQADNQELGGYYCEFKHWLYVETGNTNSYPIWIITVPFAESTHTFIAYYKGGPYYANIYMPIGGEEWVIGDSGIIIWGVGSGTSPGLDNTTLIDVYLDRNSGANGYNEVLFTDIPRLGNIGINCPVTGPPSTKCRVKIVAQDCVENTATDISTYDFTIRFPNIVGDVNTDGSVTVSDPVFLINYVCKGGPPPVPLWKGEVNGDCDVTVSDIVYLINFTMKGGAEPVDCQTSCGWDCIR